MLGFAFGLKQESIAELGAPDQFLGSPGALFILVPSPGALNPFGTLSSVKSFVQDVMFLEISLI